jgi:hypothetical protein
MRKGSPVWRYFWGLVRDGKGTFMTAASSYVPWLSLSCATCTQDVRKQGEPLTVVAR